MSHHRAPRLAWTVLLLISMLAPFAHPAPAAAQNTTTAWADAQESGGIVYFLYATNPVVIKRYDLAAQSWLPDLTFARALTAFTVDADGLYAAEPGVYAAKAGAVYRYGLDGSNESHLYDVENIYAQVNSLRVYANLLLVIVHQDPAGIYVSLDKASGNLVRRASYLSYMLDNPALAPNRRLLTGRTSKVATPTNVVTVQFQADGSFGSPYPRPYRDNYPPGDRVWFFPDESLLLDGGGIIFTSDTLAYHASLDRTVEDAVFSGGLPVILNRGTLYSYSTGFLQAGRYTPAAAPERIFLRGQAIFAFRNTPTGPAVEQIPLSAIQPVIPAPVVDPSQLNYQADQVEIGADDTLYLMHKASKNIFRWSPATRRYLPSIPLVDTPVGFTYDPGDNSLFVAYSGGNTMAGNWVPGWISRIRLTGTGTGQTFAEQPFANLTFGPCGNLMMLGDYLLTTYQTGWNSFVMFTLFDRAGGVVSRLNYGDYSTEYTWNPAKRRLYFTDDGISGNYLHWQPVDASGVMGSEYEGPLLGYSVLMHPIRATADGGAVLIGDGRLFNGDTFAQTGALGTTISDGAFTSSGLVTLRSVSGSSQAQQWNSSYTLARTSPSLPGTPRRLLAYQGGWVVVTLYNGKTRISLLDPNLNILSTPPLIDSVTASPASGDAPLAVNLSAQVSQGTADSYTWDFGDGQTVSGASPTHTFLHNGRYTVKLTVSGPGGQDVYTGNDLVSVNSTSADFSADPITGLAPLGVQFTNLTNGTVFSAIQWDFGDGTTSSEKDPFHIYSVPGEYTVTLTMDGPGGRDSETRAGYIQALYGVFLPEIEWTYPVFTKPGTYTFNRCQTFGVYSGSQKVVNMTECVQSVEAREDGYLKFNYTWRASYLNLDPFICLTKYSDLDNPNMYIANQNGRVYHFTEGGGAADYIGCMEHNVTYPGWFLFPPAADRATIYTFYDRDNNVALKNLAIPLK